MASHTAERVPVGVLGGGAWGTAVAIHCARMGHPTVVWALEKEVVDGINVQHHNKVFLPGYHCPPLMSATNNLEHVITGAELVLSVIPTQFIERTLTKVAHLFDPSKHIIVSCSKGITTDTLEIVSELLKRILPPAIHPRLSYLSGPSFAAEVAAEKPSAVTIAAEDDTIGSRVQLLLSTQRLRCYRTQDVPGVELGGALKNILAIACGISDALDYGNNARAALMTRGLYEITKLAVAKGADPLTMVGLAGLGDLVLTCTGDLSRNRVVGKRIGKGETLEDIAKSMNGAVAEGVPTAKAAFQLAQKLGIDCPIVEGIHKVVHLGAHPGLVVTAVMSRDLKPELEPQVAHAPGRAMLRSML